MSEARQQIVALSLVKNMGPVTFKNLLAAFGDVNGIFKASRAEIMKAKGSKAHIDASELKSASLLKKADIEIKKAADANVKIVTFFDKNYPAALKELYAPPILLYVKGVLPDETTRKVAVVGSRIASLYGQRMAKTIARDLAAAGVVVVSGMARGIDSAAHEGALSADGVTVGVLGGGINKLYPRENKKMAEEIAVKGAVISEYPIDMTPKPEYFPVRNRIISGLSSAVLVVEAKEKSGALITVDAALEQGRDVFAVPGNADSLRSGGTNALIKQGAKMVTSAHDILEELNMGRPSRNGASAKQRSVAHLQLTKEENKILSALEAEPLHVDDLIEESGLKAGQAISVLSAMEIKGVIKQLPGKYFALR